MPRPRKYATPEEAHAAKLAQAREKYRQSRIGVERKKWGFINTVVTADMVGKTIKELEAEYKAKRQAERSAERPSKQKVEPAEQKVEEPTEEPVEEPAEESTEEQTEE